MNFTGRMEGQETQVRLKYCERCGGLWLRPQGTEGVYCGSCRVRLEGMANPEEAPQRKTRRRKARAQGRDFQANAQGEDLQISARIDYLQGVAAMEVRA